MGRTLSAWVYRAQPGLHCILSLTAVAELSSVTTCFLASLPSLERPMAPEGKKGACRCGSVGGLAQHETLTSSAVLQKTKEMWKGRRLLPWLCHWWGLGKRCRLKTQRGSAQRGSAETCVFPDFHITQDMGRRASDLLDKPAVTELHFRPPLPGSYKIANPTAY